MPTMKDKDLLKLLERNGWQVIRINGSHYKMRKGNKTVIVPVHKKDMKIGTLNAILRDAGLPLMH